MIIPSLLKAGDKVALVAPAKSITEFDGLLDRTVALLRSWGLQPEPSAHAHLRHDEFYPFSASDADRLNDLQRALDDPEIRGIFCLRGGYGTSRLLDQLDFSGFEAAPKWVIGYSDVTALLSHLYRLGYASLHGPMPVEYDLPDYAEGVESIRRSLLEGPGALDFKGNHPQSNLSGRLIGGNLSLLSHLLDTPSEADWSDCILFTEEVGEDPYRIDRMLLQLHRSGRLRNLKGILLGTLSSNPNWQAQGEQLFMEYARLNHLSVWTGFPCAHGPENRALVSGAKVFLQPIEGGTRLAYQTE